MRNKIEALIKDNVALKEKLNTFEITLYNMREIVKEIESDMAHATNAMLAITETHDKLIQFIVAEGEMAN